MKLYLLKTLRKNKLVFFKLEVNSEVVGCGIKMNHALILTFVSIYLKKDLIDRYNKAAQVFCTIIHAKFYSKD